MDEASENLPNSVSGEMKIIPESLKKVWSMKVSSFTERTLCELQRIWCRRQWHRHRSTGSAEFVFGEPSKGCPIRDDSISLLKGTLFSFLE
jgi:hypothetical protein